MREPTVFDTEKYIRPQALSGERVVTIKRYGKVEMKVPPRGNTERGAESVEVVDALWFSDWDISTQYLPLNITRKLDLVELFGMFPSAYVGKRITLRAGKQSGKATVVIGHAQQVAPTPAPTAPAPKDEHGFTHDGTPTVTTQALGAQLNRGQVYNELVRIRKEWQLRGGTPNPIDRAVMGRMTAEELGAMIEIAKVGIAALTEPAPTDEPYSVVGTDGQVDFGQGD